MYKTGFPLDFGTFCTTCSTQGEHYLRCLPGDPSQRSSAELSSHLHCGGSMLLNGSTGSDPPEKHVGKTKPKMLMGVGSH